MLKEAFDGYQNHCKCGVSYDGLNCAHFLSNTLINTGFTELGKLEDAATCPSCRPIRAKELHKWFKDNFTFCPDPPTDGYTLVYQERQSDGQGHVLLMKFPEKETRGGFHNGWSNFYYQ